MDIKVMQAVAPNMVLKLPKNQCTEKGREKAAAELTKRFRELIINLKPEELTIDKYKEMVYSLIPSINPPINVVQINEERTLGALSTSGVCQPLNKEFLYIHNGYRVMLNLDDNRIISDKSVVVHETRHLFDAICIHKRYMKKGIYYIYDAESYKKLIGIQKVLDFSKKPITGEYLQERLSGLNCDVVVNILQKLRHSAQNEVNAYKEEFLFNMQQCTNVLSKIKYLIKYYTNHNTGDVMKENIRTITKELQKALRSRHNT